MSFGPSDLATAMGVHLYGVDHLKYLSPVGNHGWYPLVREPYSGAWQQNNEWTVDSVLAHPTVYSCVSLISNDFGKLRQKLVLKDDEDGIWSETESPSFSPVLRRPNRFQNHIQFKQWWMMSKLLRGNTVALKQRDQRGVVVALYILDWTKVTPLVAPDGSVFYDLGVDNLPGLQEALRVPASEVIHDRMNCLFHPLVGVSPIFAAGAAANIGLRIEGNSASFFGNASSPGGILVAPGAITQATADRLASYFNDNFTGSKSGRIAAVGDGLKFEQLRMSATDSQLIETLNWSDKKICSVYHVPAYKVGVGEPPAYNNIGALATEYYSTCLQTPIEEYEACMDEGLGIDERVGGKQYGVELDLDGLIRMDPVAQVELAAKEVDGSLASIDEGRAKLGRKKVTGGSTLWMQQQNYSLEALMKRDANDPFAKPAPAPAIAPQEDDEDLAPEDAEKQLDALIEKELADA